MARIPQGFIDDVVARTDIVQLIDSRVALKRKGSEYSACCPFHDEKSPSFFVSPAKQFYHCFGCGAHGTALGFLIEYDRLEFRDAVEELAKQHGLEIPQEAQSSGPRVDPTLYDALNTAQALFQRQLRGAPAAIEYLQARGIDGETAKAFGIGFAEDQWQATTDAVGNQNLAVAAGLAIRNDAGRVYDRFRGRIMFPIRDLRGRVVSFGGRSFGADDSGPKYLNGPETDVFHKGRMLYGLFEARQASKALPRLIVVEGYMDVVSLAQFGVPEAVATLGTATTAEHLELLFRSTDQVVFCFDGDRAGRDAGWKAVERALPVIRDGREVRLLFLPDGEDPDSLVRAEGADAFRARLDAATPLSEFLLETLGAQADLGSVDGRARLVELARPHLEALGRGAFRTGLLNAIAQRAGLGPDDVERALAAAPKRRAPEPRQAPGHAQDEALDHLPPPTGPLARACRLLLEDPALAHTVSESAEFRDAPGLDVFTTLLNTCQDAELTPAQLHEHLRGTAIWPHLPALRQLDVVDDAQARRAEFEAITAQLARPSDKQRLDTLLARERGGEISEAERAEMLALLKGLVRKQAH